MRKILDLAIRALVIAALFVATHAHAAQPRLATDCTSPGSAPTEAVPFDLDRCSIASGDDISLLLDDIRAAWPTAFYVRAPSRTLSVIADSKTWTVDTFMFFEDESPLNKLTIQHKTNPADYYSLWIFENFDTVKIGGPNLSLTFIGNHPGLANCLAQYPAHTASSNCDANRGLIEFAMTDGSQATLADVRANIRFSQHYAIYTTGSGCHTSVCGTANKIAQLNVAGVMYATSGVFFHQGVRNAWSDPDRFVVADPYVRVFGWDGTLATETWNGRPVGCISQPNSQPRAASFTGYYTDSITGGMTLEYGALNWVMRYTGSVGSAAAPYLLRLKDYGTSGPGTAYPAGVKPKKAWDQILFKGDPAYLPDNPGFDRFVRIIKQPDQYLFNGQTYGSGVYEDGATGPCATDYAWTGGSGLDLIRLENSFTSNPNQDWRFELSGDFTFPLAVLIDFAKSDDDQPNRRHGLRLKADAIINDAVTMRDTTTLDGPGTFQNISVEDANAIVQAQNNTITNTNVAGVVTVSASAGTTTISNVNFTGAARAVITIGAGSTVVASNLCVPDTSTITGTGTLTYNGSGKALPYTITPAAGCNPATIADPAPAPPTGGSVQ